MPSLPYTTGVCSLLFRSSRILLFKCGGMHHSDACFTYTFTSLIRFVSKMNRIACGNLQVRFHPSREISTKQNKKFPLIVAMLPKAAFLLPQQYSCYWSFTEGFPVPCHNKTSAGKCVPWGFHGNIFSAH